jgi:hypothetical protein
MTLKMKNVRIETAHITNAIWASRRTMNRPTR